MHRRTKQDILIMAGGTLVAVAVAIIALATVTLWHTH
jgi:hypothetical protein